MISMKALYSPCQILTVMRPPGDLENVKTKFYKGSNSVRGSGIGLALVDSIMTALDGTMDLKSTLGRGTVVTLGLPIYKR